MHPIWRRFLPEQAPLSPRERVRSALGALIGIVATGLVCTAALGPDAALPALIAPMGASAVLLFAVPASPLAQPWSILGGNTVAALIGVTAAAVVSDPAWAAGLAIALTIATMMSLRCVHPPSGAVALTAVLGGPAIRDLGYGFVLWPVGANSLLMLAAALLFNNLTGRPYPHARVAAPDRGTADPAPTTRIGFSSSDLDEALKTFDQLLDVGRGDLEAILRQAQINSYRRRSGQVACADIMSRDVIAVAPGDSLAEALSLLRRHRIKVLPVTDESARVLGIVTQTDLLDKAAWDRSGPRLGLGRRLRLMLQRGQAPHGCVADIMTTSVKTLFPESPIADVVARMAESGLHHLPVVGADGRLVGIVSQTDLVSALLADAAGNRSEERSPPAGGLEPAMPSPA
ncbi:HPP family protein [Methylobacterium sp. sgz302541]|uniref:HPP family protein n=1 Tax=unclassified Methylobacterium TaxID=2615210 RepID=UPI003D343B15